MEARDLTLVEKYREKDSEIQALWEQHLEFESMLNKLEAKPCLSSTQKEEIKQLKKKKLAGKTKLGLLLDKYREAEA